MGAGKTERCFKENGDTKMKKIVLRNKSLDLLIEEIEKYNGHPTYVDSEWKVNSPLSMGLFGGFKIVLRKKTQIELDRDIERKTLLNDFC